MSAMQDLYKYRKKLEQRYHKFIQLYNDYKYVDECKSDVACYKAMKILQKINRVKYLQNSLV